MSGLQVGSCDRDDVSSLERFVMTTGETFWIDRRGWIFDAEFRSVPHPLVDSVMNAVIAWERR